MNFYRTSEGTLKNLEIYKHDKDPGWSIFRFEESGPFFGGGADLFIDDLCTSNKNSYSKLGYSYGSKQNIPEQNCKEEILAGSHHFKVDSYEVFTPIHNFTRSRNVLKEIV